MDISEITTTLMQMPIVGLFIWFIMRTNKEHRSEREKKDEKFTNAVNQCASAISHLDMTTREFHNEVIEWRRENRRSNQA